MTITGKGQGNARQTQVTQTKVAQKIVSNTKLVSLAWIALAASLLLTSAGCGSSRSNTMSATQAQAVSQEFSMALQSALSTALPAASQVRRESHPSLAAIFAAVHAEDSSGCTVSGNGESCTIPVSYSGNCPGGGTIGITGDFDFTLNSSGDGSDATSLTITPTNCSVSNLTINGDPSVTASTQINFANDAPVFPINSSAATPVTSWRSRAPGWLR